MGFIDCALSQFSHVVHICILNISGHTCVCESILLPLTFIVIDCTSLRIDEI